MAPPLPPVSRSSDFWFDDGNLVLHVEATKFRIHRGLICASSAVFRDMHALSQPEHQDTVDGCPVVVLPGDTAADWANLLEYMYFPARALQEGDYLSFPRVASMLRLGTKYEFAEIRALALRTIRTQVPVDSLKAWDELFVPERRSYMSPSGDKWQSSPNDYIVPGNWLDDNHFDLLNLAIDQGIQTVLPMVYYLCLHWHSLEEILHGFERADGTLSTIHPHAIPTLLLGRQELHTYYPLITMNWLTSGDVPVRSCLRTSSTPTGNPDVDSMTLCQQSRMNALVLLATSHPDYTGALDRLSNDWRPGFCDPCMERIGRASEIQRERIFRDLPSYFNLPEWDDLRDRE